LPVPDSAGQVEPVLAVHVQLALANPAGRVSVMVAAFAALISGD